jgi:hypothetical protein
LCRFQYNDFAIKAQEGGLPDFFDGVTRIARSHHQLEKETTHATRHPDCCLAVTSHAALAQELTAA